jgi:D-lactate dehydrogenase (cytochrome)
MNSAFIIEEVVRTHPDFLRDESRGMGSADALALPSTEDELCASLAFARERGLSVTVQGGRTGLTGGAVPDGGLVINLTRMNRVSGMRQTAEGNFVGIVQPGVMLQDLRRMLIGREFDTAGWSEASLAALEVFRAAPLHFFPPDPTEATATLGGMAACNASGACTFRYGAMRQHVVALRMVLADGDVVVLRRGEVRAQGLEFVLETENHRRLAGRLPAYTMPDVKNSAGYFAAADMDLLDLFIGSEGTLGIFSELELQFQPVPAVRWGLLAFFSDQATAVQCVLAARALGDMQLAALEFFDCHSLALLRREREHIAELAALPELSSHFHTAVYFEIHAPDDVMAGITTEKLLTCGVDGENSWMATTTHDMEKFKAFRHALPEAVNRLIDEYRKTEPALTKLGTDMAVPDKCLLAILERYRLDMESAGLDYLIFGHIGDNHLHVNILPASAAEYQCGRDLYREWAADIVKLGGTVAAEHGIGKLKAPLLKTMFGSRGIAEMRVTKRCFDPDMRLNAGNLFSAQVDREISAYG